MYMARVFIERGNLGIFEDVVLDQGKGYSMVQCCSLSLTLIRVLGSMNTAGILCICVVRIRSTFFCRQEREKLRQSNAKAPVPFQVLGKRAAKTLDMVQYVIGFLSDLPGDEREDSKNIGALLLRPLHPTPKKRILFLVHDNADKWQ